MCGRCRRTVSIDPETKTFRCFKCDAAAAESKAPPEGTGLSTGLRVERIGDRSIKRRGGDGKVSSERPPLFAGGA